MKHYLLFYDVVDDFEHRRLPFRQDHLSHAQAAVERGDLLLGGALTDPVDGAVLLFRAATRDIVEDFARNDPYVRNRLVTRWSVRKWTTVVGNDAAEKP